jgi:hypothetical protein
MADNPLLRGRDGNTVSSQPHEIAYVKAQLKSQFPRRTDAEIESAIQSCKSAIAPSELRSNLMACATGKLK